MLLQALESCNVMLEVSRDMLILFDPQPLAIALELATFFTTNQFILKANKIDYLYYLSKDIYNLYV